MNNFRFACNCWTVMVMVLALTPASSALSTRTWVSGTGLDSNACSETAPCATFAGALAKTAIGGEIDCLDAGEFGIVAISGSITIDCGGTFGSIHASTGQTGIRVSAQASDRVTLRNLSITGGIAGVSFDVASGMASLHIENLTVSGATTCLISSSSGSSLMTVDNATLSDCSDGVDVNTTSGTAVVNINNSRITNTGSGIVADNGSRITLRGSTVYFNNEAVLQTALFGSNLGSTVTVVDSTLGFSNTAALQSRSGEFILAFGNTFVNDVLVYNPNGGMIFTGGDNNNSGSAPGTANGGVVPKF